MQDRRGKAKHMVLQYLV